MSNEKPKKMAKKKLTEAQRLDLVEGSMHEAAKKVADLKLQLDTQRHYLEQVVSDLRQREALDPMARLSRLKMRLVRVAGRTVASADEVVCAFREAWSPTMPKTTPVGTATSTAVAGIGVVSLLAMSLFRGAAATSQKGGPK